MANAKPAPKPQPKPTTAVQIGQPQAMRALPERMASLVAQKHFIELVEDIYGTLMVKDVDYGNPIGSNGKPIFPKPMLYKSGAELLRLYLELQLRITVDDSRCDYSTPVLRYRVTTDIYDKDGQFLGSGEGVCSSMESKYRYRWLYGNQLSADMKMGMTIVKDGKEYIDTQKWIDAHGPGSAQMTSYGVRIRLENADIADQENTILSQAKKRSFADGIKTVTGASRIFSIGQEAIQAAVKVKEYEGETIEGEVLSVEDIEEQAIKVAPDLIAYQQRLKDAMKDMPPAQLQQIMKDNFNQSNIADLTPEQREALLDIISGQSPSSEPIPMKTIGDLYTACYKKWKMQPDDVLKELGLSDQKQIANLADAYDQIYAVKEIKEV